MSVLDQATASVASRTVVVRGLTKAFPGTLALDQVSLEVRPGEVHAVCGANGSGKSTLVKVLTGIYQPDSGTIALGGMEVKRFASPAEAASLGIRSVQQEAPLVNTFTVAECIALFHGYPTDGIGRVRWSAVKRYAAELLARLDIDVAVDALCGNISPSQRAMVSLAIALGDSDERLSLLLLDESTAAIPEKDAGPFLDRVRRVADLGHPVLMVTHRVSEVPAVADRVTVLADGRIVHTGPAAGLTEEQLVNYMLASAPPSTAVAVAETRAEPSPPDDQQTAAPTQGWLSSLLHHAEGQATEENVLLDVENLVADGIAEVGFRLHAGEILGIAGLADSGVAELPAVLTGARDHAAGVIRIVGTELPRHPEPRLAIEAGIALIPADRLREGGIATLPLRENIVLPQVARLWRHGAEEKRMVADIVTGLDIHPAAPDAPLASFSGGNQQRAIIGKWLLMRPRVLVLDDPTYGVDPRARQAIFEILREGARQGLGMLFFSTEPEQLVLMCDRVLVMRDGRFVKELAGEELTRENVARWSAL